MIARFYKYDFWIPDKILSWNRKILEKIFFSNLKKISKKKIWKIFEILLFQLEIENFENFGKKWKNKILKSLKIYLKIFKKKYSKIKKINIFWKSVFQKIWKTLFQKICWHFLDFWIFFLVNLQINFKIFKKKFKIFKISNFELKK